jgi:hypothetical protein
MLAGVRCYPNALAAAGVSRVDHESPGTSHEWLTERRDLRAVGARLFR